MVGILVPLAVLAVLIFGGWAIRKHILNSVASTSNPLAKIGIVVAEVVGIVGAAFVLAVAWAPVTRVVARYAGTTGGMAAAIFFATIAIVGIWTVWSFSRKFFSWAFPGAPAVWFGRIATIIAVVSSVYFLLDATGLAALHGGVWQWTARISVIALAAILGVIAIRWWYPKGQNSVGVGLTYVVNVVTSGLGLTALGYNAFATLNGTMYTLLFFVALNFGLFWLSFGLSTPGKPIRRQWGFWIMAPWTVIWVLICAYMVANIGLGRITWPDAETNRILTEARKKVEILDRTQASMGMSADSEELAAFAEAGDFTAAKAKLQILEQKAAAQNAVERSDASLPKAIQEDVKAVMSARPLDRFRNPDGIEPAEEVGFRVTKISSTCWEVEFLTSQPVEVLKRWEGQPISFSISPIGSSAMFSTSGSGMGSLPFGSPMTPGGRTLTLQAKKGVKLTMNF